METQNIKLGIGAYLGILLLLCLLVGIYAKDTIIHAMLDSTGQAQVLEAQKASDKTAGILLSLGKITFDTSVLNSTYLQTLTPFVNFPIDAQTLSNFGKTNPFLGSFTVVSSQASSSVGGVVYSNQRAANNGQSIIPVSPNRR
jgi:hypothetical protein